MSGWIKIHRQIEDHWVFENPVYLKRWLTILMKANHSDRKINLGYDLIDINSGQCAYSLRTWSAIFECGTKQTTKFFDMLENDGMIKRETIGSGKQSTTLINISNYEQFQTIKETQGTTQEDAKGKRKGNARGIQLKNVKKEKKEKKYISSNGDKYTEAEILEKYKSLISKWNEIKGTKFKAGPNNLASFKFWFEIYSANEIVDAVKNHDNTFWNEKLDPTFLFRQKNKNGPCDYIGELLQHKPKTNFF